MARARQHRRRQRVAQAAADAITVAGAAAGLASRWSPRTSQTPHGHTGPSGHDPAALASINILGSQCAGPEAITLDGRHAWVACSGNIGTIPGIGILQGAAHIGGIGSVIELDAATGAPTRVLTGPRYEFDGPSAIATDGTRVWVANYNGGSVTEFPASSQ